MAPSGRDELRRYMNMENGSGRITAGKRLDANGQPKAYVLRNRNEEIALEAGKPWLQLDTYKWVTRGLIEEPRGFHVLPTGAVELHGEQIELNDPDGEAKLEKQINERFQTPRLKPFTPASVPKPPSTDGPKKAVLKVRVDKMGHLMVACLRGGERVETGIRGLEGLVRNGLMLKPKSVHLDPLLRYVEIDDIRFESDLAGAEKLEKHLNDLYAPPDRGDGEAAIEIKSNPAAPSGFDIHFVTFRAGARFEIKGHLCEEYLDILQDPIKCQLLRPGILLRLSPPHLIIRRRRADGGEEKIPELPDVRYLHATAAELQSVLNHPVIRRGVNSAEKPEPDNEHKKCAEVVQFHLLRNPKNKMFLWLETVTANGKVDSHVHAFTHHNVAELQHASVFRPSLDVVLSWDNRTLSVRNTETHQEELIAVDYSSNDAELDRAAQMLTAALKAATPEH